MKNFVAGAIMAGTGALVLAAAPSDAQTLRLGHHHAVGGQVDQTANKFAALAKEKSGGKLTVTVFPAAQLAQEREAFQLLNQGVLDLTITSLGLMDVYSPPFAITSLPFVYRDWDHVIKAFDGEFGRELNAGLSQKSNAQLLGYIHLGFRDMIFRGEPVADVSRMRGLKMRAPESYVWIRMFELLGARPTPVTWGEVYTAMQTGVAEGLESPAMVALDMKFNEVTKSVVRTGHMFASMAIAANKNLVSRLPADLQKALSEAGAEAARWSSLSLAQPGEQEAYKIMTSRGMRVVEAINPDAWAAPMKPLWEEMSAKDRETGRLLNLLIATK